MDKDVYGMKGSNQVKMNQATVKAAMQLWVDTFMVGNQVVTSVKADGSGYHDGLVLNLQNDEVPND